jgi:putative membrane protein
MKMKTPTSIRLSAILLAGSLSSVVMAQSDLSPPSPTTGTQSPRTMTPMSDMPSSGMAVKGDKSFFEKAGKSGTDEVAISQGASERLNNPQVKDFAQTMISDHTAANAQLMTLASSKGVMLPPMDKEAMKLQESWSKRTKGVDQDYLSKMVSDHEDAVKLFTKATKSEDADVAAFAQKTLPTLQHHLMMAQDLQKSLK